MSRASKSALAWSVNNAIYTANAHRPVRRSKLLFGWSFFASWITIEFAWFHLACQLIGLAVFGRLGGFKNRDGKAALGLTVASCAGLAVSVKQSLDVKDEIAAALGPIVQQRVPRRKLAIKRTRNVEYAMVAVERNRWGRRHRGGEQRMMGLKLDVFQPAAPPKPGERRPVVMQIHGGGWVIGDKREQGLPLLKLLASQGWVGFNVNYRLSPSVAFPEMLIDLKRAIAWIRDHADEYGLDPDFIAVTGGSAGGHLTALVALTANDPQYQPEFEDADTSVQAAVPFYGVYDFTNRNGHWLPDTVERFIEPVVMRAKLEHNPELFARASPFDQVHADAPPFLIIHGDKDTLAPVEDARDFSSRLTNVSESPVHYLELHGAQHAFDILPSIRCHAVIDAVDHYLTYQYELAQRRDLLEARVDAAPELADTNV